MKPESKESAEGQNTTEPAYEHVAPIRGATRLFAVLLGLAFLCGSAGFLRAIWRDPPRFEWAGSRWLLTVAGVLFALVGVQFCIQAAIPENLARIANDRRRRRAEQRRKS